jgi:hypothetical protein
MACTSRIKTSRSWWNRVIHQPRAEQALLIPRLAEWLRPHGQLLVNLGISDDTGFIDPDWLGTPMYWSSYTADTYLDMIRQADLTVVEAKIIADDEDGKPVRFLWIWAEKSRVGEPEWPECGSTETAWPSS